MDFNMISLANRISDRSLGKMESEVIEKYPLFRKLYNVLSPHSDLILDVDGLEDEDGLSVEVEFKRGVDPVCIHDDIADECLDEYLIDIHVVNNRLILELDPDTEVDDEDE